MATTTPRQYPIVLSHRDTVGVYLPNKPFKETWRLTRIYARELRNMNMADFVNRAKDVRLKFTPDLNEMMGRGFALPGATLGLDQRRNENGLSLRAPKRTKTRCIRPIWYSPTQCADVNGARVHA